MMFDVLMRLPRLCCTGLKPFKFDILFLPRALLIRQVQKMKCDYDCSSILSGTSAVVSCCSSSPGLALLFPLCLVAMRYCHSVTKENVCLTSFCTCFLFFCIHGFCGYHLSFSGTESASAPSDSQSQIYAPGSELVERAVEGEARRSWKVELHTHTCSRRLFLLSFRFVMFLLFPVALVTPDSFSSSLVPRSLSLHP